MFPRMSVRILLFLLSVPALAQQQGERLFGANCGGCHARSEMDGRIRNDWSGRPASELFEITRQTMPATAPGVLSDADYLDLVEYMLDITGVIRPAGELTAESLESIALHPGPPAEKRKQYSWRYIHGDISANRYAPLDQINANNVRQLEIAWRWSGGNFGPTPEIRNVNMPIVYDGRLYLAAGMTRNVVALDAETGQTLWMWRPNEGERFANAARKSSGHGVSYWESVDGRRRVVTVTPGYYLVSLDATTGLPDADFGDHGRVDLTVGLRRAEDRDLDIGLNAPPLVVGDVIVVGAAHDISFKPPYKRNVKGDVRGFDARSGKLLWTFHTIPDPGEPGYETWYDGSAVYTGNAGVWAPMSADPELGLVFLPVEAPTGDFYGGPRHGANLYGNSLVALDFRTGKMRWYFQMVHHDIWDFDNPTAPILADLPDGRKLAIQVTKQNFAYVFDRATGEPVWPIEERPVPQSDVPGEWTSPTQPFPSKPAPYDRQGFSHDDLIAYTPEIRAAVEEVIAQYRLSASLYTPPSLKDAPDGTKGTLSLPYSTGGANFEGSAYDPETGFLYVPSASHPSLYALVSGAGASDIDYVDTNTNAPTVFGLELVKPPFGRITAIDLNTGEHVWMIANGDTPKAYAESPALEGVDLPRTGKPTRAGIVVTKTLLFAGEGWGTVGNIRGDPVFRAHDKRTGNIIAEIDLPGTQTGPPSTYMVNGRQFIVMTVTDGKSPAQLIALALPRYVTNALAGE